MNKYEKPQFKFEELKLFERVADKCWGTSHIWLDINNDDKITDIDLNLATTGGCQGDESATNINNAITAYNKMLEEYFLSGDIKVVYNYNQDLGKYLENNPTAILERIEAVAEPNWANTQAVTGGGIIITKS